MGHYSSKRAGGDIFQALRGVPIIAEAHAFDKGEP